MVGNTVNYDFDTLLHLASQIAWAIFTVYAILFFVQNFTRYGIRKALIYEFSFRVLGPLLLVVTLSLISAAVVFIQPPMVGVVISILTPGGIRKQPLKAGFHLIVPIMEQVEQYPIYWQTYTMSSSPSEGNKIGDDSIRARTSDGQEVRLDCSLIFRVNAAQAVQVHIDWQGRYIDDLVRPVTRGFVRTQVSQFEVEEVNSSARKDLEATLDRLLRQRFTDKGLNLDQFLLRDVAFSPEYALAIEQKQVALERRTQKEYEAEQIRQLAKGEADAIEIKAKAQAEALKMIAEALEQNSDLLTYRYIDQISPNIRVMLLPSNSPLILPLPNLEEIEPLTSTLTSTQTLDINVLNP